MRFSPCLYSSCTFPSSKSSFPSSPLSSFPRKQGEQKNAIFLPSYEGRQEEGLFLTRRCSAESAASSTSTATLSTSSSKLQSSETKRPKTGVLMLNMGGPKKADEVQDFLTRLFLDRDIIKLPFQVSSQRLSALNFPRPLPEPPGPSDRQAPHSLHHREVRRDRRRIAHLRLDGQASEDEASRRRRLIKTRPSSLPLSLFCLQLFLCQKRVSRGEKRTKVLPRPHSKQTLRASQPN